MLNNVVVIVVEIGRVINGDLIIIIVGVLIGEIGIINMMKIYLVGDEIVNG